MATERGSLGLGQRLALLGAWLVSAGFVYVLGVYVGKGMRGGVGGIPPHVTLPVDVAEPAPPPSEVQSPLTFYDVLGAPSGAGGPPSSVPKAVAAAPAPSIPEPAGPTDGLTEQKLDARPVAASPASRPEAVVPTPVTATAAATPATTPRALLPPPRVAAAPPQAAIPPEPPIVHAPTPSPAAASAPAAPVPVAASGRWTVYANPSRDQLAVEHERAALRAKGYPAEVVTIRRDGDAWYRIRVGRYATQTQAEEASRRLRADGAGHAFVQSE